MSVVTLGWGALISALLIAFMLGMAPVFAVRCIARIYPSGHDRRAELVGEMDHVKRLGKTMELWRWLGEMLANALCDGVPARRRARAERRNRGTDVVVSPVSIPAWTESYNDHDGRTMARGEIPVMTEEVLRGLDEVYGSDLPGLRDAPPG